MYSVLPTHQIITNFSLPMNWFMYTIFQCKHCLKPLTKVKTYILKICYWCLFMMQSEKAQLISCFVNDYCIPTTLFKTISNLKIKTILLFFTQTGLCKLWSCFFQIALFKRKKGTVRSPVLYSRLSVSLSLSLSVCLVSSILLSNVSCVRTHYVSFIQF